MARCEEDREDLFAELATYSPRWELRLPNEANSVVLARRDDGRLAIYFGQDPCFHFNGAGELLRGFVDGRLYRTQGTTLARLQRQRLPGETQLLRSNLTDLELHEFLHRASLRIRQLIDALLQHEDPGPFILRATAHAPETLAGTAHWIAEHVLPLRLAPPYPTRR